MCTIRTILIVEDDDNDFILVSRALKTSGFHGKIIRAGNGEEAIPTLEQAGGDPFSLPALVLLDLKTPRKDGFEVLKWRRQHLELPCVPFIVFSSSREDHDVKRAYELGAHGYIMKPIQMDAYVSLCHSLQDWWSRCELTEG